jgi:hypothetical protein
VVSRRRRGLRRDIGIAPERARSARLLVQARPAPRARMMNCPAPFNVFAPAAAAALSASYSPSPSSSTAY